MSRTKNSILNFITDILPWILIGFLGFYKNRIFLSFLGEEITGILAIFGNILSYLSLADGGIGSAVDYFLYKPLSEGNKEKVSSIFNGTRRILFFVGIIILCSALLLSFAIPVFVKYETVTNEFVRMLFILFTLNVVIGFMTYQPYLSLITADQKRYKINIQIQAFKFLVILSSIVMIQLRISLLLVLLIELLLNVLQALFIISYVRKEYPFISNKVKADYSILSMTKDSLIHRLAVTVTYNTDNFVIGGVMGSAFVPFYNNYNLIIGFLIQIVNRIYGAITHSLGNLFVKESLEKRQKTYLELSQASAFLALSLTPVFIVSVDPFFENWLENGAQYQLGVFTSVLFGLYLYSTIYRKPLILLNDINGMFKETKIIRLIEAAINISISLILVQRLGINGVLIGTIISHFIFGTLAFAHKLIPNLLNFKKRYFLKNYIIDLLLLLLLVYLDFTLINGQGLYHSSGIILWLFNTSIIFLLNFIFLITYFSLFRHDFRSFLQRIIKLGDKS